MQDEQSAIRGIDVSHWQGNIDWDKVAASKQIKFAYAKATQGRSVVDSWFTDNWSEIKRVGLLRGAYHFFMPHEDTQKQVDRFLRTVNPQPGDLPLALDLEDADGAGAVYLSDVVHAWLVAFEKSTGYKPLIYTGGWFIRNYMTPTPSYLADYPLWLAEYDVASPHIPKPWQDYAIWQYHSGPHNIPGVATDLDLDTANPNAYRLLGLVPESQVIASSAPTFPLVGLHGPGAAEWIASNNVNAWLTDVLYAGADYTVRSIKYDPKITHTILNLRYSFAKSDGGLGTFPPVAEYARFIDWCARVIKASNAWGYTIGNEPNRAGERPDYKDSGDPGTAIPAGAVADIVNKIASQTRSARVSPPAIDPYNSETQDPLIYYTTLVGLLDRLDFAALHAYSFGKNQLPNSDSKFDPPMQWQYHGFRAWEPFANVLYTRDPAIPLVITESGPIADGSQWSNDAAPWVRAMYDYIKNWNSSPGKQYVHAACLFRYDGAPWDFKDCDKVLEVLKITS